MVTMAYTPRTFYKDGETVVAESAVEDIQLLWEGWTPGGPAPERPPFSQRELTALNAAYARRAADETISGAWDFTTAPTVDGAPFGATGSVAWGDVTGKPTEFAPAAHTQAASTITDFPEAVQDAVAAMMVSGANVTLTYNDTAGTLQVTAAGGDAEVMRDTIGAALVGTNGVSVAVNDAADTITLSVSSVTTAQVTGLQAALDAKAASGHTHAIADVTGLQAALDGKIGSLTYVNAVTGSRYTVLYDGSAWPASRPSSRADIYFDLIGGSNAVADPAWMLNGDAREVTA